MRAKIISVVNQKGGVGKTTLTMQLAAAFCRNHGRVLVVDADPQGTATTWSSAATEDDPFPATVSGLSAAKGKIHQEIKKYVDDYDFIFVDCPPNINSPEPQSALLVSDMALVPILPSPPDMWASVSISQIIENAQAVNEDLEARLVLNQKQPNRTLSRDALVVLEEFQIPCMETEVHQREVYRHSATVGGSVFDFGKRAAPAVKEIEGLASEMVGLLSA